MIEFTHIFLLVLPQTQVENQITASVVEQS